MKIAVLMSTFNGEKYLKEQIDSIINQDINEQVDIIVRDDGSNDNTIHILEKYNKLISSNRKFIWYEDGMHLNSSKSFFKLLTDANDYDYYLFSDQDDYWYDYKISTLIDLINKESDNYEIIFTNAEVVDENLDNLGRNVRKNSPPLDFKSVICCLEPQGCTMILNKKFRDYLVSHKIPNNIYQHDEFISKILVSINGNLNFYNKPLIKYRQHSNNISGISNNLFKVIKIYCDTIFNKRTVPISLEVRDIINIYNNDISDDKKIFLNKILNYNNNLSNKLQLVFDFDIKSISFFAIIKEKLTFLFGNK